MHGWLAFIAGVFAVIGSVLLYEAFYGVTYYGIDVQTTIAIGVVLLVIAAIAVWLLYAAVRAQYRRVKTGKEALMGAKGVAVTDIKPKGEIRVLGEFWQATAKDAQISSGQTVEVVGMAGMFLVVKLAEEKA
jgi:membrane-bound serine protease (ClpP class)